MTLTILGVTLVTFPQFWDLTACDLSLTFTMDLSGSTPPAMWDSSLATIGLRNPTGSQGAAWLSAAALAAFEDKENDRDYTGDGIPDPTLDLDDELELD